MPVGRLGDRGRNDDAGGVNGLPDIVPIDTAGDFFDEDGREFLGSKGAMDAQEVDLGH